MTRTNERADGSGPAAVAVDEPDDRAPVFRIVVIGDQGSGKSTFISTVYQCMSVDGDGERGYYLSTELDEGIALNREADKTASPGSNWAAKTTWVDSGIDLDFQVPLAGAPAGVLRVRFTDYPGEYLRDDTAGGAEQRRALKNAIAEADALLLLVDGHRLLKALQEGGDHRREFDASLRATVNVVQGAPMVHSGRPAPPVQILVTKWDLLAAGKYTLPRIRAALIRDEHFRTMVSVRTAARAASGVAHGRVRIIPVSVVGLGAVETVAREQNGIRVEILVKKHGSRAPINLDVPICAILPDRLDQILAGLSPRMRRRVQRHERLALLRAQGRTVRRFAQLADTTQDRISGVIGLIVPGPSEKVSKAVLALVAQWAEQKPGATAADPSAFAVDVLRRVDRHAVLARRTLLQRFASRLTRFQDDWEGWDAEEGLREHMGKRPRSGA